MLGDVQAARRTLQVRYLHSMWALEFKSQQGAVSFTSHSFFLSASVNSVTHLFVLDCLFMHAHN